MFMVAPFWEQEQIQVFPAGCLCVAGSMSAWSTWLPCFMLCRLQSALYKACSCAQARSLVSGFIQEPIQSEHIVPLSEKFRMAYVSRAERVAAKAERNYQQRKRRELRNDTVLQALARFKFL